MTVDQYYAAIKALGLRPSNVPNVYWDADGYARNVRDPRNLTEEQRAAFITKLKLEMGIEGRS